MIGVKIAPAKPLSRCQRAKGGMWDSRIDGIPAKPLEHGEKLFAILLERGGRSPANPLFHLWARRDTFGPADRHIQSDPFH